MGIDKKAGVKARSEKNMKAIYEKKIKFIPSELVKKGIEILKCKKYGN